MILINFCLQRLVMSLIISIFAVLSREVTIKEIFITLLGFFLNHAAKIYEILPKK